jgi:hypothetical protein
VENLVSGTFYEVKARRCTTGGVTVVVIVEATVEAKTPVQNECADERAGSVAGLPQSFCQRRRLRTQTECTVVTDPVTWRE